MKCHPKWDFKSVEKVADISEKPAWPGKKAFQDQEMVSSGNRVKMLIGI
jgi:hypothetical protein